MTKQLLIIQNLDGGVQQILVKGSFFGTRVALQQPQHKPSLGPHKKRKRNDESRPVNDETTIEENQVELENPCQDINSDFLA